MKKTKTGITVIIICIMIGVFGITAMAGDLIRTCDQVGCGRSLSERSDGPTQGHWSDTHTYFVGTKKKTCTVLFQQVDVVRTCSVHGQRQHGRCTLESHNNCDAGDIYNYDMYWDQ